jgi:hypothetical protein
VVPCGHRKIWDGEPFRGPASAAATGTGTPIRLDRQYARRFGDAWVAIGAKFGFIKPEVLIPES